MGAEILNKARELSQNAERRDGGKGTDTDGNGKVEYDCSGLVFDTLKKLGYDIPYKSAGNMESSGYYDAISLDQAQAGDIVITKNANGGWHAAIFVDYDPITRFGIFYGSQSNGIAEAVFGPNALYWKKEFKILRPKEHLTPAQPNPPSLSDTSDRIQRRDPLVLDLTGNGIQTFGTDAGLHFDYDNNGFKELTGWVAAGSGMLMLDRNADEMLTNGAELFGDFTPLQNGLMAVNGFQALAQYDTNGDSKIDASDPIWSQLRIWQYDPEGTDLADPDSSGMLSTLAELGITAIYLDSTATNQTDSAGNTELRAGHFEWANGSTSKVAEYRFQRDMTDTVATTFLDVAPDIDALPQLKGYGNMYDLHQAMARDGSGELKALAESFMAQTDPGQRAAILEQILFNWAGVDEVTPNSRGPNMDGRKVAFLEKLYGRSLQNPDSNLAILWEQTYRQVFESYYADLMAETHLENLFQAVTYTYDEEAQSTNGDLSVVITEIQGRLSSDPVAGKETLAEFARTLRGLQMQNMVDYLSFREAFIQQDPELGWVIDSGGLPVMDWSGPGPLPPWWHMMGTDGSEAMKGGWEQGDGIMNSEYGDDVIYGSSRDEWLINEGGNAVMVGGGGNDALLAGEGDDLLDGGNGNDWLVGEAGNDTYIFRRGSGQEQRFRSGLSPTVCLRSLEGAFCVDRGVPLWYQAPCLPYNILLISRRKVHCGDICYSIGSRQKVRYPRLIDIPNAWSPNRKR